MEEKNKNEEYENMKKLLQDLSYPKIMNKIWPPGKSLIKILCYLCYKANFQAALPAIGKTPGLQQGTSSAKAGVYTMWSL